MSGPKNALPTWPRVAVSRPRPGDGPRVAPQEEESKRTVTCSACGKTGHNKRKCPGKQD